LPDIRKPQKPQDVSNVKIVINGTGLGSGVTSNGKRLIQVASNETKKSFAFSKR
jgi:uncharacterized Fe-S cluster-containing radical SAM superfamily enzyme